ncbi:unnamed protein product [Vitrella brassicaformis CCMP3155]|uniref:Phenazine biosynthesis protein n=1 Tax=Vitrella brassicaformis (strain CCMP3155) TaxID=1169540 RepID=A0A0G4EVJ6_VITBC|nr:unnamed protein product [Vitrella brassicaformis CCMP3155]|eukprot:CEM02303.1 unnamed protein product [Vitrella brassicaformis CCMP3155]
MPETDSIMASNRKYFFVDVFTSKPLSGAQIVVLPDAEGISDDKMQAIAREFGTETVFCLPGTDGANTRVRIWTPLKELTFGGHPTIAAIHTLVGPGADLAHMASKLPPNKTGRVDFTITQPVGPISVSSELLNGAPGWCRWGYATECRVDTGVPFPTTMAATLGLALDDVETDTKPPTVGLSVKGERMDVKLYARAVYPKEIGLPYLIVPVKSYAAVRKAELNRKLWEDRDCNADEILLITTDTEFEGSTFHGRLLGLDVGIHEDPPVGSSIPALSAYLLQMVENDKKAAGREPGGQETVKYSIERGTEDRRESKVAGKTRFSLLEVEASLEPVVASDIPTKRPSGLSGSAMKVAMKVSGKAVTTGEGVLYDTVFHNN